MAVVLCRWIPQKYLPSPQNKFVAGFIGNPAMNIMLLDIEPGTRGLRTAENLILPLNTRLSNLLEQYPHSSVWFGIRSEAIQLASQHDVSAFDAHITNVERMGNEDLLHFNIGEQHMILRINSSPDWALFPANLSK